MSYRSTSTDYTGVYEALLRPGPVDVIEALCDETDFGRAMMSGFRTQKIRDFARSLGWMD